MHPSGHDHPYIGGGMIMMDFLRLLPPSLFPKPKAMKVGSRISDGRRITLVGMERGRWEGSKKKASRPG